MLTRSLLSVGLIVLCLWLSVPAVSASSEDKPEKTSTIAVTGTATDEVPPDTAVITLAVETHAKTAGEAARENSKVTEQVIAVLKKLVNTGAGDTVRTSSYQVQPEYEYDKARRKNVVTGYRTTNQVTVETGLISRVGEIIDRSLAAGANNVSNVRFILRNDRKYCEGLLVKAAGRARSDAETVAGALGVELSGIRHIAPACHKEGPPPVFRGAAFMKAAEMAEPTTPIEAGTLTLNSSVAVEFYLEK